MKKILMGVLLVVTMLTLGAGGFLYTQYSKGRQSAEQMLEQKKKELQQRASGKKPQLTIEEIIKLNEKKAEERKKLPPQPLRSGIDPAYQKAMQAEMIKRAQELQKQKTQTQEPPK